MGYCWPRTFPNNNSKLLSLSEWSYHRYHITLVYDNFRITHFYLFIIVFDITKRESFVNLQKWIEEVRRYTASNVILILIGNKCDLEKERAVEIDEVQQMCQYIPEILFVFETSAKENRNIDDVFITLATELKRRVENTKLQSHDDDDDAIKLGQSKPLQTCSNGCKMT